MRPNIWPNTARQSQLWHAFQPIASTPRTVPQLFHSFYKRKCTKPASLAKRSMWLQSAAHPSSAKPSHRTHGTNPWRIQICFEVTASQFTTHITSTCDGMHAIFIANLTTPIQGLFTQANNIPDYTNMLEDAQYKVQQEGMPIPDMHPVAIPTQKILATKQSPLTTLVREGKIPVVKTWSAWKESYI